MDKKYDWSKWVINPYFSKSLNLIFPLLGMKRDEKYKPATYMYWEDGDENIENLELLVYYQEIDESFEKEKIINHVLLKSCYEMEKGMLYIFDVSKFSADVYLFIEGKYSEFSKESKQIVRKYHGDTYIKNEPLEGHFIHQVFNPDVYSKLLAEELGVTLDCLNKHGQSWDKPNVKKETLLINKIEDCKCIQQKIIYYEK